MLYITVKAFHNDIEGGAERCWHLGDDSPAWMTDSTLSVQADCDELAYIRNNFSNIPFHKTAIVQSWTGDFAKFIVRHLGYY
jgi:hypothetical protein